MNHGRLLAISAFAALLAGAGPAAAQTYVQCESREYQYQFCPIPQGATRVTLVEQRSRSACIEGRSWGWDRRGVWVSNGCDGVFDAASQGPAVLADHEPYSMMPTTLGQTVVTCGGGVGWPGSHSNRSMPVPAQSCAAPLRWLMNSTGR